MKLAAILVAGLLALAGPGLAQTVCKGRNLLETLSDSQRQQLDAAVADVPFAQGLLWRAEKGDRAATIVGTYHFGDPRHQPMVDRLGPVIGDAAFLLVEAGPEEEATLTEALASDPMLTVAPDGPTLPERLTDDEWKRLSAALSDRGVPAVVASRLRPWYVAMLLGVAPCMIQQVAEAGGTQGLDHLLIAEAETRQTPIRALEPWDTVFEIFAQIPAEQQIDLVRSSLPAAAYADDYAVTLTAAYFAGDVWTLWEFWRLDAYEKSGMSAQQIDEDMAQAQLVMIDQRNANWIAPLAAAADEAAGQGKQVVMAVGALHLPGENGVLQLLQDDGWIVTPLQ